MSLGVKKFVDYISLTANELNQYLMQQTVMVFASSAARTSAFSTAGVTITEGMVSYLLDTNLTEYYDGSAWVSYLTTATANISISGTFTAGSNATMSTSGFYVVGNTTLNRANATAFTTGGSLRLQIDGVTQATIGANGAQYGDIAVTGTGRNGWTGINFGGSSSAGTPHLMFSGNSGGQYHYGDWATYWSTGNLCLAIGGSTTTAGYKLHVNGAIRSDQVIDSGGRFRSHYMPNIAAELQMRSGNATSFNWNGSYQFIVDSSHVKTFTIQHPTKPDNLLVHACTEGLTADVFYRGQAQLKAGICVVTLPDYFEELTELENRSVMLTPIADENGMVANLAAYEIEDGQFLVEQIGGYHVPDQRFWWRVDAVRKNTAFNVEPEKSSVTVHGMGPYTYIESNA